MTDTDPWEGNPIGMVSPVVRPVGTPQRLSPVEASKYLHEVHGVSRAVPTLAKLRCPGYGSGPLFRRLGRRVVYEAKDLDAWVASITTEHGAICSEIKELKKD